jgi:hypothetical protein
MGLNWLKKDDWLWLNRAAFLWLFLVAVKLTCPMLCEHNRINVSPDKSSVATQTEESQTVVEAQSLYSQLQQESRNFISSLTHGEENTRDDDTGCKDECLCHTLAIVTTQFSQEEVFIKMPVPTEEEFLLLAAFLPEHYLPPKQA